jgi:hypothetical protein
MVRPVTEGITVTIKGRLFELVWDDENRFYSPCQLCAFTSEVCKDSYAANLIPLCSILVQEPGTYFIEKEVKK